MKLVHTLSDYVRLSIHYGKLMWNKIVYAGIDGSADSFTLVGVNSMSFFIVLLNLTVGIAYGLVSGKGEVLFGALVEAFLVAGIIWLNHRQKYEVANISFFIILNLATIYFSSTLGKNVDANLMILFLIGLAWFLYPEPSMKIYCICIAIISFIALEYNFKNKVIPELDISEGTRDFMRWTSHAVISSLVILLFHFYDKNKRSKIDIEKMNVSETEEILKKLIETSAARTSYMRDAVHEIKNAMAGLRTTIICIQSKAENLTEINEDWLSLARRTNNAFEVLQDVTHNVIRFSKIEAGKDEFDSVEAVELRLLIHSIVKANEFIAQEKGIKITTSIADNLPERIITDTMFITRILSNLIINSIKFTSRNGNIIVSVFANNDRTFWNISVEDDGKGIAPSEFSKIFDAFATKKNKEENPEGIGLGLYIVKKLVGLMQGKISLTSLPGKATCFTVSIPFRLQFEGFAEIITSDT